MTLYRKTQIASWLLGTALLSMSAWADIASATGDCVADTIETTPSSDFTLLENGAVVRHETTGLEWRRCPEGMSWSGSGCSGSASAFTWQGAVQHADGYGGWRLPSLNELRSIVELCRQSPAINLQAFPGTPSPYFWSTTPLAGYSNEEVWVVSFGSGKVSFANVNWGGKVHGGRVRLVRGGQ